MTEERRIRLSAVLDKRQPDITIVMENVFDPHNISAVMRTCDAVGIQDIYVLNTRIPPHKKWDAKTSSSAAQWLSVHQFTDTATCFGTLRKIYDKIYTTHLNSEAISLYEADFTQRIALIFGNETEGVTEEARRLSDGNLVIPQVGMIQSLNISVACAVTLYEAYRQKSVAGHYQNARLGDEARLKVKLQWGLEAGS